MQMAKSARLIGAGLVLVAAAFGIDRPLLAQATDPAYLAGMPSVERVKAQITGADPTDTVARQVAVFNYLGEYIQRIKFNRTVRGPFTADEQRYLNLYSLASYQLSQDYKKTHTPAEVSTFESMHNRYEVYSALDWVKGLVNSQAGAAYKDAEVSLAATAKKHDDEINQRNDGATGKKNSGGTAEANRGSSAPGHSSIGIFGDAVDAANDTSILNNDPVTNAARRCLELGGTKAECLGDAALTSVAGIFKALAPDRTKASKASLFSGPRIGGSYRADNGLVLAFGQDLVVENCGRLVPDGHRYTLTLRGAETIIDVGSDPSPFRLILGPNGQMVGPGPVVINGRMITGYQVYNVQRRYSDGNIVPGSVHQEQVPIYAPRTERCALASLQPMPAAKAQDSSGGLFSMFFGDEQSAESQLKSNHPVQAGLRMAGAYAGAGGLHLDFGPSVVTLDCGEAHTLATYSVRNASGQVVITVDNRSGTLEVTLQPNNTLAGSGTLAVSGRIITGETSEDFTYRPSHQSCSIGSLTPPS